MKKAVKFVSGFALIAAFIFVGFSSFTTPDEVVNNTPEAVVVVDDCGCPPGWRYQTLKSTNVNAMQWDSNEDGVLCYKLLGEKGELNKGGQQKGNNRGTWGPRVYKDNNQPCDD